MIQKTHLIAFIILICVGSSILYASEHGLIDGEHKLSHYVEMMPQHLLQLNTLHKNRTFLNQQERLKEAIVKIPQDRAEAIFNYFIGLDKCLIF